MASLTIRNLDEQLKAQLRVRAASRGRSMEEEVRHILRAALEESQTPTIDLAERIRRRFARLGDIDLPIAPREPVREAVLPDEVSGTGAAGSPKARASRRRRRA